MNLDSLRAKVAQRLPAALTKTPGTAVAVRDIDTDTVKTTIALTRVAGNITWSGRAATAWYLLPERQYAWVPATKQAELLDRIAIQHATLVGHDIHLRRTTIPWPVQKWAVDIHKRTGRAVLDFNAWSRDLVATQKRVMADGATVGLTLLGVSLTSGRNTTDDDLAEQAARIGADLAGGGLAAEPATEYQIAWMVNRSLTLGHNPPERVDLLRYPEQVYALSEKVDWYGEPYGRSIKVIDRHSTDERYTAVLTMGRMEKLDIPGQHQPWLYMLQALPFQVDVSVRGRIVDDDPVLRRKLKTVRALQTDYADHELAEPLELERVIAQARQVEDDIETGTPEKASRAQLRIRVAVSGATLKECLDRVAELQRLYRNELHLQVVHTRDQLAVARTFCPGEHDVPNGYVRHLDMGYLSTGLPQAGSDLGDGVGDFLGFTNGVDRRPVFFDGNLAPRNNRSGLAVFVGDQGAGKSTLLGMMARAHALRGVQVTILDPSGPLARLARIPELAPYTRIVDLTGAEPGTLAPYALVPDPHRHAYEPGPDGDREYATAVKAARAERRALVLDLTSMLLGAGFTGRENLLLALRKAMQRVQPVETSTLEDVIDALHAIGEANSDVDAKTCETLLVDARELPYADLFFGRPPDGALTTDAPLTVITMAGITMPDMSIDRSHWSTEEAIAVALLHTAYRLAVRRCYSGPMSRPKLVGLDEAHILNAWASGRAFLVRLARDSRKWNLAALVASQNPKDILDLLVQNLVSTVFIGRVADDPDVTADAVRLLRLPPGVGFEEQLAALSYTPPTLPGRPAPPAAKFREFVVRDQYGRVGRIEASTAHLPAAVRRHLDTTPGGPR